ncbi:MAG: hypothetical protein D6711_04000 [Chloroflexi bacterium]|nr:MAG: hypothetical protein D6711_04000 [Chloroflexota bacterium]
MRSVVFLILMFLVPLGNVWAQETDNPEPISLPSSHLLSGFTYHPQMWNNCGPATLTMGLSYFGYADNQVRAARWLKPNQEDKNVSPWQMVQFVNSQIPEIPVYALMRYGGTLETLKLLNYYGYPVLIEAGYDPERANQGWMGHYLLVIGYDDINQEIITHDSYDGENLRYSYEHIQEHWQHFNYVYIVLYESGAEPALLNLLGDDADVRQNYINAFYLAQEEAIADPNDAFAWFNMGSMLVELEMYEDAAAAFDQAFSLGLPWRMLWYQFTPYEAYLAVGRYDDVLTLAREVIDSSSDYVEEAYYYAGIAREALGETDRAIANYNRVLSFNPNFEAARERRDALQGG